MTKSAETNRELEVKLGKIKSVNFGHVHDRDFLIGLNVILEGKGWGVSSGFQFNISDSCKWEKSEKEKAALELVEKINSLLKSAKVQTVEQLKDIPIEATFNGMVLVEWRILEEVL